MDKWTICNKTADFERIAQTAGISEITARLLVNRDLTDDEDIRRFLNPTYEDLYSPHLMLNLDSATELIAAKIEAHKKIRVVGDYDVDGIMATFIFDDALKSVGADSDWYIPHRIRDGYGLNEDIIRTAAADGVDTVITCDNGISAREASLVAESLGLTLIITDHHEIPDVLPVAAAIVDPKQEADTYPCREICGAVVAAKVASALFERMGADIQISRYLEFMAMATICDVVALKGENRVIAKLGLEALKTTKNPGLAKLIEETGIVPASLSEYHVGYILGPCFNATGRIDDAGLAFEMLSSKDVAHARELATECKNLNEERKVMTAEQEKIAFDMLDAMGDALPKVVVLELPDCHESLLGIIAGRIKERYNRPAIVVTKSKDNYKGSARSIPAYNMFEELCGVREYLVRFGGHPMAAGLTVFGDKLEEFRQALNARCTLTEDDMVHKLLIDAEISFNLFTEEIINELNLMAPFGAANASPIFAERGLKLKGLKKIGKEGNYLRFRLENKYGHEVTGTCFNDADSILADLTAKYGEREVERALYSGDNNIVLTAAYVPRMNEYRDVKEIQMNIKALRI